LRIQGTLKGRFTIFTVILVVVVSAAAVFAQKNVTKTSHAVVEDLSVRHASHEITEQIQTNLFNSYENLSLFLLDPTRAHLRAQIHSAIKKAIQASEQLTQFEFSSNAALPDLTPQHLSKLLHDLQQNYTNVLDKRLVSTDQYPSLGLGGTLLRPNRILFVNSAEIAISEIEGLSDEQFNRKLYESFVEVRQLWGQMVSNFRLYLANRLGSYNEQALSIQEEGIDATYQLLLDELKIIEEMNFQGAVGFEASNALLDMKVSASNWFNGFQQVKAIHHSGQWRSDVEILKRDIEPKLNAISENINSMNELFNKGQVNNLNALQSAAKVQSHYMWIILACVILFFVMCLVFFERLILRPVSVVSEAMKAVAYGENGVSLPAASVSETQHLVDAFNKMRAQVRSRQFELEHQALHDGLTGLANRNLLRDRLGQAVHSAKQSQGECSLLILNIARFKDINKTLGHHSGDLLLVEIGIRIESVLRDIDTVARLSGDEFAILLYQSNLPYTRRVIDKIERALQSITTIGENKIYVTAAFGVATYPEHGNNANCLLKHADAALHYTKTERKTFSFYNELKHDVSPSRLTLTGDLSEAIRNSELHLEYQPQVDLKTGEVVEVEALIRWQHKRLGAISAEQIISVAEQTAQINSLTNWVLNNASIQCEKWRKLGHQFSISVNLSVLNLQEEKFVDDIKRCLDKFQLTNRCLTFEITESAMMLNPGNAIKTLKQMDLMGLKLVVDDFGTGFSSLSYLKNLPVSNLKLDKSFVMSLSTDSSDEVIVRSTIELAHNLGLKVVAEGVENEKSLDILSKLSCDFVQGYYLSRPKKPDELIEWINSENVISL